MIRFQFPETTKVLTRCSSSFSCEEKTEQQRGRVGRLREREGEREHGE